MNQAISGDVYTSWGRKSGARIGLIVAVVLCLCLHTGAGYAAEGVLEEIVVTAQKRPQRLIEVPFSVQAIEGLAMEAASIRDLSEIITLVPGASEELSTNAGFRRYQIRGIAQGPGDPTIGYYFDDAAYFIYGLVYAPVGRAFDMDRVEVLRGPQSTLYGNSSMGGTIRFIPTLPDLEQSSFSARAGVSATHGGEPGYYVDAVANLPLVTDTLALRLVASHEDVGGYQEIPSANLEDVNDGSLKTFRASLLWTPNDKLSLKLHVLHNEATQNGGTLLASLDPPVNIGQPGDFSDADYDLYTGTLSYELPRATLTSTTTWIDFNSLEVNSFPFPVPGGMLVQNLGNRGEGFNNETRLVSAGDTKLDWLVGVFYSSSDLDQTFDFNPAIVPPSLQTFSSEGLSVFSEVAFPMMDGKLVPLVGLRYFRDDRETFSDSFSTQIPEETFDSMNPRFNISYMPDENSQYYFNAAKGFRSGGFNHPDLCPLHVNLGGLPCEQAIDSDTLWSQEVGMKRSVPGGNASYELAVYYQDWQDVRMRVPFAGIFQEYQVGDAEIYGVDLVMSYAPASIDGLNLDAALNWNSAEFSQIDPALLAATGAQVGDRLPFVPEWTLSLNANYSWTLTGGWEGGLFAGYSYIAEQAGRFATQSEGDARNLLSFRVGARSDKFGVYLFGRNVLNEDGAIYAQTPIGGVQTFSQDYPRQLGIEITVDF